MRTLRKFMFKILNKNQKFFQGISMVFFIIAFYNLSSAITLPVHIRDKTITTATFTVDPLKLFTETGYSVEIRANIKNIFDNQTPPIPYSQFEPKAYSAKINTNSVTFISNNQNVNFKLTVFMQYGNGNQVVIATMPTFQPLSILNNELVLTTQTGSQTFKDIVQETIVESPNNPYKRVQFIVQIQFLSMPWGANFSLDFSMYTSINTEKTIP
jgi:hypothetical protein